jgi:hypothetical protein
MALPASAGTLNNPSRCSSSARNFRAIPSAGPIHHQNTGFDAVQPVVFNEKHRQARRKTQKVLAL